MSSGPTLQTFVSKKKETNDFTFEQVTDPDNYTKKRQTQPMVMIVGGASKPNSKEDSIEVSRSKLKPRIKYPGYIGPLENPDDYTEIPKPVPLVQSAPTLKLKSYNGRSK